jgi:hypothetical protein
MRVVSSDGTITVETIRLSCTDGRDGDWLGVKRHDERSRNGRNSPDIQTPFDTLEGTHRAPALADAKYAGAHAR